MIIGVVRDSGALQPTADVLEQALREGHVDGVPFLVLQDILQDRDVKAPSASQIASVTWRRTVLERHVSYYIKPQDQMAMYRGTLIHSGFETIIPPQGVNVLKEVRLKVDLDGWELTGQEDLYWPDYKRLEDWKTCYKVPDLIKEDHVVQLAVYTWLLRWNGYEVDSARINYVSWYGLQQRQEAKMPNNRTANVMLHPLLADEEKFRDHIDLAFTVLNMGFENQIVPSTQHCTLQYCRNCPVKWACDALPEGSSRQPDLSKMRQEDYFYG